MTNKPFGCDCGWSGSTQQGLVGHLSIAHGINVRMPPERLRDQRDETALREMRERQGVR